jgi:hypothetical protein
MLCCAVSPQALLQAEWDATNAAEVMKAVADPPGEHTIAGEEGGRGGGGESTQTAHIIERLTQGVSPASTGAVSGVVVFRVGP